ncbi:class I SAM-dependent methyltransferase [Oceaniglobus ichthyenteri]|uniref:class I SAM-dependent methyltransferase n=1 Tax=Oceaniglobus ichthyenteri TaxID=2136177 RepID=UPI000D3B8673|nr:class I SAM-dependent methyltransferase [Oceaniglobus ichthyenteri]
MLTSRISFARDQGVFVLPEGRLCVFGARGSDDLTALDNVQVVQGLRPDYEALQARGIDVVTAPEGEFAAALVVLPRAKDAARDLIAQATALVGDGPVWIDGQKTDGADSMIRTLRKRGTTVEPVIAKAHGKLFCITGADVTDWRAGPKTLSNGMITAPGVFSADGIDKGSALLVEYLPEDMKGTVVDLGAGWGFLAAHLAERGDITALHLVEADHAALTCARENVTDPRAQFHWADATTFTLTGGADHVVMNPPFHVSRSADPDLGRAFIDAAARLLKPNGQLWLVANRHLPYEATLTERFIKNTVLSDDPAFKVIHAERPRRKPVQR